MTDPAEGFVTAGRVGRPHGLDGSFYVQDPQPSLLELGRVLKLDAGEAAIERRAGTDAKPIVRLSGHSGREAAQALGGVELRVPRSEAPPLGEDEWWPEQLEGCTVVDGATEVGVVTRMRALPSCEVLEVERPGASELLVPLVRDAVRSVDVDARRIDIDLAFLGEAAS